jgi:hypothetical protein
VELTFSTRKYKRKVSKSAVIYSSDLADSQVRIRVSAQVDPEPDTTLPFTYSPNSLQFTQEDKELDVVFSNKTDRTMYLKSVGDTYDDLKMKMDDMRIKAGEDKKIEFSWTGEFERENIERSITFDISASSTERVTIPFVVEGTNPAPVKSAARRKATPHQVKSGTDKK